MLFARKVKIEFSEQDGYILDGQSRICNWLYNVLYETNEEEYKEKGKENKLLSGRNLRNEVPKIKENMQFLNAVHSSPLKNVALRLKQSYVSFFKGITEHPKYRSWKKKWFSLYYDEPNKGWKILDNNQIEISLGQSEVTGKYIHVVGNLKENLKLRKEDNLKNFRLCKEKGVFYGVFTVEREYVVQEEKEDKILTWLSIDPNHKNFFMAIDNEGKTILFEKIELVKYWDKVIDELKSKRDKHKRKSVLMTQEKGGNYYKASNEWERIDNALLKAINTKREQIKQVLFAIANWIAKNYDVVAIGDYAPSTETAVYDNMHRSMLNQEHIGMFRRILAWVMKRSEKKYYKIDETNTTKKCCICGYLEKKDPSIREFECIKCHSRLNRDINSAVNIAVKNKFLSRSDYLGWDLSQPGYTVKWNFRNSKINLKQAAGAAC
jgi:putative transposase